jgi:predicted transcriptional regulator
MTQTFGSEEPIGKMGSVSRDVLEAIVKEWPMNPLDVANSLGDTGSKKTLSSKYLYHFRRLKHLGLIEMKRTGNTYIAWPMDMEKLRIIHELLRVE